MQMLDGRNELYQHVASVIGEALFEWDPGDHRLAWSADVGALLLDYAPGELNLQLDTLKALAHEEDLPRLQEAIAQLIAGHRVKEDFRLRNQAGQFCWVQLAGGATRAADGDVTRIRGVLRSTQELHEALLSLYEARRMETVGNMASGIAHEFNNHLTPIRGYLELALDHLGDTHTLSEGLRTALDRVQYCTDLVSQIQAYGQKSMLIPGPVDVRRVIPTTARLALSSYPDAADLITLKEIWPAEIPSIWVDQGQLQQALLHVFRNAIEAMPQGGTLTIEADDFAPTSPASANGTQPKTRRDGFLYIRVTDTGKGIRPEDRSRIFEPFFTTHGRAVARGMGLPMVQGMVAQHGGWIEIKTEVGQGTIVTLYLPEVAENQKTAAPVVIDGAMPVDAAATPGSCLIADDELFIRRLIRKVFQNEGWHIEEAEDNDQVVEQLETNGAEVSLIILDLTMPGLSTEAVMRRIPSLAPNARVLFISGFARDDRIERLMNSVPSDFVGKPFSPRQLLTKVDELMHA